MVLLIAFMVITTQIDPADEATIATRSNRVDVFDSNKHAHVIENYFCKICNTEV